MSYSDWKIPGKSFGFFSAAAGRNGGARSSEAGQHRSRKRRRVHHGQCCLGWIGSESRAAGGNLRRFATRSGCHDYKQSLWLGIESGGPGCTGNRDGQQFRRGGRRHGIDSMAHDGLWDVYNDYHMGMTGENVAEKYGISREEQDEFAVNSHRKAVSALKECRFESQILPVELPAKKKGQPPVIFEKDESPREDTTIEALRALKPAFKKDGTVTAGNAPGVNDGAAAVVVTSAVRAKELGAKPMVRIVAQATSGVDPKWVMMAPVGAVRKIWEKTGWKNEDVDLYELNEAFSVQALGVMRELGLDPNRVNVNGGAVALGHPIGAS